MTTTKAYWLGFEDGLADCVERTIGLTAQEAYAYRNGFRAGMKARDEMN